MSAIVADIFALERDFSAGSAANATYFVHFIHLCIVFTGSAVKLK